MEEHRSLGFWAAIGSALVAIGGIVAGVGLVEESRSAHGDVWPNLQTAHRS
jgi:hypothetical protein